jgi:hypothetical protein
LGLTASIVPQQVMFMTRGSLIPVRQPDIDDIRCAREHIVNESFTPSYVNRTKQYTRRLYWKTFLLFKARGVFYQIIRYLKRDRFNLHYLDALNHLDHKPSWRDYSVLDAFDADWEAKFLTVDSSKRVFIGLQLLPEASLDYWLKDVSLLDNERVMIEVCHVLSDAGYTVFVKDHPLQFGFRKRALIESLQLINGVVLVPYAVPATQLIKDCGITLTMTGTIGFQSAVAGSCSIVSEAYYSDDAHFVQLRSWDDIATLPDAINAFRSALNDRITDDGIDSLLSRVLAASAPGDLFGFKKFDADNAAHIQRTVSLVESLNAYLPQFLKAQISL